MPWNSCFALSAKEHNMRTFCIFIAPLLLYGGVALAGSLPDPLKAITAPPALHDSSGRFALTASLSPPPLAAKRSADGRFALRADLDQVSAPLPHTDRYTLQSALGEQTQGAVCGGALPDVMFRNGFEN
jgi:hypothetical protein